MNQKANVKEGSLIVGDDTNGFHAGLLTEVGLNRNIYLQPQFLFSRKGA